MKKILITDDSLFQRKILTDLVKELGYSFEAVDSGEDLLETIDDTYDCIFLDLLMKGMSGLQVLEQLKKRGNKIPVVVISADIQERRIEECYQLGAFAFLKKIPTKEEIEKTLNELFS